MDQPYGRYARRFDHNAGMNEMFFELDDNFYSNSQSANEATISVTYFDGNGNWALNYFDGKNKQRAYQVKGNNTKRWITKTIKLNGYFTNSLKRNADITLEYLSGDDTYFALIELER